MVLVPLVTTLLTGGIARFSVEAYAKDDLASVTSITTTTFGIIAAVCPILLVMGAFVVWRCDLFFNVDPVYLGDLRIMLSLTILGVVFPASSSTIYRWVPPASGIRHSELDSGNRAGSASVHSVHPTLSCEHESHLGFGRDVLRDRSRANLRDYLVVEVG